MRFLLALLLALIVACTASSDVRMHPAASPVTEAAFTQDVLVDDAFDDADQDAIAGAVYTWNTTFAGALTLRVNRARMSVGAMATGSILIMKVKSDCTFIPSTRRAGNVLAFTDRIGGRKVWLIRDRLGSWQVQPVTLHELGHVFGALDREGPGLMHYELRPLEARCVDKATADEVAIWLSLPPASLAYCTLS